MDQDKLTGAPPEELSAKPSADPEETEQKSEEEKKQDLKKKAVKAGVALFTSASVLVGGLFPSPDAILADEQDLNPVAIVQNDNDNDDLDGDGGDGDSGSQEDEEETGEETGGLRAGLRQKLLQLPLALRVFVLVPLWAVGWVIWTVAGGLWTMLLGPIAGKAVSWLFLLGALLGALVLGMKTVFPNMPLKKIVNKKSLLGLLLGGLTLGVADLTVPLFWDGYEQLAHVLKASGMALILGTVSFALIRRLLKKKGSEAAAAPEPEEEKPWTDAEILALADSVSRRR